MTTKRINIGLEYRIAVAVGEIIADVRKGIVPKTVTTFGELHDFVDANEYGGLCDGEMMDALRASLDGNEEEVMVFANKLQDAVDGWLRGGGVTNLALLEGTANMLAVQHGIRL